jgi:anti-sigma B factor antagonist
MEIREATQGDVLVLTPNASVTASEDTSALESKLAAVLKAGTKLVVIDCTSVSQLASAAVRVLLSVSRRLDRTGGRLVLCAMSPKLRKAFTISGVDKDFVIVATREEGVQRALEPVRVAEPAPRPEPRPATPPAVIERPIAPAEPFVADAPASALPPALVMESPAATPPPVAIETRAPAIDPREALATSIMHALGIKDVPAVLGTSSDPRADLDALAAGLLAAIRVHAS